MKEPREIYLETFADIHTKRVAAKMSVRQFSTCIFIQRLFKLKEIQRRSKEK